MALRRTARTVEVVVKAGQTLSEPVTNFVGESSWAGIEFPDGLDPAHPAFRPATCETLITNTDEYTPAIDEDGAVIGPSAVTNGKYIVPLTAFFFVGLTFQFDVAPAADTKIFLSMRG